MSDKSDIKPKIGVVVPPAEMFCKYVLSDDNGKHSAAGWLIDASAEHLIDRLRAYRDWFGTSAITDNDFGRVPGPEILRRLIALSDDLIEIPDVSGAK